MPEPESRVTLIGRPGCHLCDEARAVIDRVTAELGVSWEERSIDDDAELRAEYADPGDPGRRPAPRLLAGGRGTVAFGPDLTAGYRTETSIAGLSTWW